MDTFLLIKGEQRSAGKVVRDHTNTIVKYTLRDDLKAPVQTGDFEADLAADLAHGLVAEVDDPLWGTDDEFRHIWTGTAYRTRDNNDKLIEAIKLKRQELKNYAAGLVSDVYGGGDGRLIYQILKDSRALVIPAARANIVGSGRPEQVKDIDDRKDIKIIEINALPDIPAVIAYDIPTEWVK